MGSPLFSLGRRPIEQQALANFERTLRYHGALGYRDDSVVGPTDEQARLGAVPLVFGLIPAASVVRHRYDVLVKPFIRQHLVAIGVPASELLVDILKTVADQIWATWPTDNRFGNRRRLRKASIAALRANPSLYKKMRTAQEGRCAVCGLRLDVPGEETLDHTIPFRILGDVFDGANWQLLCQACNVGKAERFSALQSLETLNWVYRDAGGNFVRAPSLETRYVVLAQTGMCEYPGCRAIPRSSELMVQRISPTGLWVTDNLCVRCPEHASNEAQRATVAPIDSDLRPPTP